MWTRETHKAIFLLATCSLAWTGTTLAQEFRASTNDSRFIAHFQDDPIDVEGKTLAAIDVWFYGRKPSSKKTETVLRHLLKASIALYSKKDILAFAWFKRGDEDVMIALRDGSTSLIYLAKDKKVMTWREHAGKPILTWKGNNYRVEYEEHGKPSATITVVFETKPSRARMYKVLVRELQRGIQKQKRKRVSFAYAKLGNWDDPASVEPLVDKRGEHISVKYDPKTGKIEGGGKVWATIGP